MRMFEWGPKFPLTFKWVLSTVGPTDKNEYDLTVSLRDPNPTQMNMMAVFVGHPQRKMN